MHCVYFLFHFPCNPFCFFDFSCGYFTFKVTISVMSEYFFRGGQSRMNAEERSRVWRNFSRHRPALDQANDSSFLFGNKKSEVRVSGEHLLPLGICRVVKFWPSAPPYVSLYGRDAFPADFLPWLERCGGSGFPASSLTRVSLW